MPPCVSFTLLISWLNGWGTARRFQCRNSRCWVHSDCMGEDSMEHYAVCDALWNALQKHTHLCPPRDLETFLVLTADDIDSLRVRACHLYSVRNGLQARKAEGRRGSLSDVDGMVKNGHRSAMLVDASLQRSFNNIRTRFALRSIGANAQSSRP